MDTNSPTAPEVTVNSTPLAPTRPQITYLNDLLAKLAEVAPTEQVEKLREDYRQQYRERTLTKHSISVVLNSLEERVRMGREHAKRMGQEVPTQRKTEFGSEVAALVPAGRYAVSGNEDQTVFVHVVKFESGGFIVKQQIGDDTHRVAKLVARAMLQKIVDAGIEKSSTRYGRELGVCGVCGRTLTNEDSRQLGIGPVCRQRLAG